MGEELVACVVLGPQASATEDELRDYVRERVADFKCPRRVWFAASLPRSRSGKLLKRAIVVPREVVAPPRDRRVSADGRSAAYDRERVVHRRAGDPLFPDAIRLRSPD